ncbi:MAG: tRNA adenosine(34) deaminase TadA [Neisseria sp.]|nr:tRNA adenosine(34) deaminase TadA [Neisseria sp.]
MKPFSTPPFSPSLIAALRDLGIHCLADLQKRTPITAFLLLKASGYTYTNSVLWQLMAFCEQKNAQDLSEAEKNAALLAIKNHMPVAVFPPEHEQQHFMQEALKQAKLAAEQGEVPVGAVVVRNGEIIAAAHNLCVSQHDISAHAEMRALVAAGKVLQNYRLSDCDVYITLEPCAMCASALLQARVKRVIFGAYETKTGAAGSVLNLFANKQLNQHTAILGGVHENECQSVLQDFFQAKRGQK